MVNVVILVGSVGSYGGTLRQTDRGSTYAKLTLIVPETTTSGRVFTTFIPCEIYGRHAKMAANVPASTLVAVKGKLARRKIGEKTWEVYVRALELIPVTLPDEPSPSAYTVTKGGAVHINGFDDEAWRGAT